MEQNKDVQPHRADPTQGEFEVGAVFPERSGGAERPDVATATDAGTDSSQALVVGDNSGVVGDADDMTSGDSATHARDDTAHRPMGLGSASGVDDATGSVSRSGQSR